MEGLYQTQRIKDLKDKMLSEPRYASIEQALIITKTYQENEDDPKIIQRAKSLKAALEKMEIRVEPEELIVGNRTAGVRYGVVFPEVAHGQIKNLKHSQQDHRTASMYIKKILRHSVRSSNHTGKENP